MANIIAIIPARGGSKGLPFKNVKLLADKPLIAHAIDVAKKSRYINKIIVSTDDLSIKKVALTYGADVIDRPVELATDTSVVSDAIRYTINVLKEQSGYEVDIIVLLECTSPIKSVEDIDLGIEQVLAGNADSSAAFKESNPSPNRLWRISENVVEPYITGANPFLSRQQQPIAYELTGQFYVVSNKIMQETPHSIAILLGRIYPIISSTRYFIDIDEEMDFIIAEQYLKSTI
jgi:CMP-N,N'-diacetyllegionaminic acid synthase